MAKNRVTALPRAALLALLSMAGSLAHSSDDKTFPLSVEALQQCADRAIAECQYRFGLVLKERGHAAAAQALLEAAFRQGFEPAGAALLDIVRAKGERIEPSGAERVPSAPATPEGHTLIMLPTEDIASSEPSAGPFRAEVIATREHVITLRVIIQNDTASRLYVTRGHLRVTQQGKALSILDSTQASTSARVGSAVLNALPGMVGLFRGKPSLSQMFTGREIAKNVGTSALSAGSRRLPRPSGREDYFSSGYVEPGSQFIGIVVVRVDDPSAPLQVEYDSRSHTHLVTVDPANAGR